MFSFQPRLAISDHAYRSTLYQVKPYLRYTTL